MTDDVAGDLRDLIRASAAYDIIAIHHAIYEIERLLVENRNLRRALRPFAVLGEVEQKAGETLTRNVPFGHSNCNYGQYSMRTYQVTGHDCLLAYKAMKETGQ